MADFSIIELLGDSPSIGVVDVGAGINKGSDEIYQMFVDLEICTVTGFEANKLSCDKLNQAFSGTAHRCLPYFIGNGEPGTFHTTWHSGCGSLYPPNKPLLEQFTSFSHNFDVLDVEEVSTVRLDDIEELGNVDFLKLDVQGGELDVLEGAEQVLGDTLVVFTEVEFVEMYEGQPLFGDVDRHLRNKGFRFNGFNGIATRAYAPMLINNNPDDGLQQPLWADVWYIRDPSTYGEVSTEQLIMLAVMMHELRGSYDLALHIFGIVDKRCNTTMGAEYLARF